MSSFLDYLNGTDFDPEPKKDGEDSDTKIILAKILNEQISTREILEEIADLLADMVENGKAPKPAQKQKSEPKEEEEPEVTKLQTTPVSFGFGNPYGVQSEPMTESANLDIGGIGDHVGEILAAVPETKS